MTPLLQTRSAGAIKRPAGMGRTTGSRGAVTAEFAVALPAVLMLLVLLLAGSAAGITQLRLEEAARAGARALARGEDSAVVDGIVRKLAGASATSVVAGDGEWQRVTVSDRMAGYLGHVVPWTLTAQAEARTESAESADLPADPQHAGCTWAVDSLQPATYSRMPA
jgi:Flp pilus assembly protein TadG